MFSCKDVPTWKWFFVGAAVGLLLALARLYAPQTPARSLDQKEFESRIIAELSPGLPSLSNITVQPYGDGYMVTGYRNLKINSQLLHTNFIFFAPTPYTPLTFRGMQDTASPTVVSFLDHLSKVYPQVEYRYIWWDSTYFLCLEYVFGGVLAIGVIWPILLRLSSGERWRQKKNVSMAIIADDSANPTTHMSDYVPSDELPERVAPTASDDNSKSVPRQSGITKLPGAPLEAPSPNDPKEEKRFGGDFYPTEVHPDAKEGGENQARQ